MSSRDLISRELAELLGVLAHPDRIRIVEQLRAGEMDVFHLQQALSLPQSRVSQHLAVLRLHRLVVERREARHVFYHLSDPSLPQWIASGVEFLRAGIGAGDRLRLALNETSDLWIEPMGEGVK
jgi:DNA-binding transcriptional ArsR family regulator